MAGIHAKYKRKKFENLLIMFNSRCAICGKRVDRYAEASHPDQATIDHIHPVSKGGTWRYDNLQLACYACNQAKADSTRLRPE